LAAMGNAGAVPLAVVIAFVSGVWPYLKIGAVLMCFLLPPERLLVKTRQRILVFVDAVGKMSLIDAIFMFVSEDALAVAWRGGSGGGRVEIQTVPGAGFVSLFGSTILCLFFGHLVLFIHRVEQQQHVAESGAGRLVLRRAASRGKRICVDALLGLSLVLLPCCFAFPVLTMHMGGGFRSLYVLLGKDTDVSLSVFDILSCDMRLSGPSMFENEFWKVALTMTAYVFGVVLPACMALELAVLWLTPLTTAKRFLGLCLVQTARAWAALDIIFASLIIAYLQLPLFMKAVTTDPNQAFTHICSGLSDHLGMDCVNVTISLEAGAVFCGVVSALLLLLSILISGEADRSLKKGDDERRLSVSSHASVV